jgi:hypothetical protein
MTSSRAEEMKEMRTHQSSRSRPLESLEYSPNPAKAPCLLLLTSNSDCYAKRISSRAEELPARGLLLLAIIKTPRYIHVDFLRWMGIRPASKMQCIHTSTVCMRCPEDLV